MTDNAPGPKPLTFTLPPKDAGPPRVPDPEKIIPPRPNLEGDDVMFARFDPSTGEIVSHGFMHRRHIVAEAKKGAAIIEHDRHGVTLDRHRVDPATKKLVDFTPPRDIPKEKQAALDSARSIIASLLDSSDRYFTADALDNITAQEQAQWRAYRQALRNASKLTDPDAMLANVPKTPKGIDPIGPMRGKPSP